MYISVIPLEKSQSRSPSTYFVSETWIDQIVVGGLIEIPIGKNLVRGIVYQIGIPLESGLSIEDIRPIHSVICTTELVSRESLKGIISLADKYFLLIHKAASLYLPAPLLSRLEKRSYVLEYGREDSRIGSFAIHHSVSGTFTPGDLAGYLVDGSVIVFPDDLMLWVFLDGRKNDEKILILPQESTAVKKSQAWIDIFEGKYSIIVGTRRILYYNLSRYKNIIYIEDAFGREQYQYPTNIRSLDTLSILTSDMKYDITLVTSTPTLELFSAFPKAKIISNKIKSN